MFLYALRAEFLKRLHEQWYYKLNYFSSIVATFIFFLGLVLVVGGDGDPLLTMVMGFLFWYYGTGIIDEMAIYTVEEAQLGTLEQIFATRTSVWAMLITKLIAMMTLSTAKVILFLLLIVFVQQDLLHYISRANWGAIVVVGFFILISLSGVGAILFGLTLIFKRIGAFAMVIQYALLFFSGILIPIEQLPVPLRIISYFSPLTYGLRVLEAIVVGHQPLWTILGSGDWWLLVSTSFIFAAAGIVVAKWYLKKAKIKGALGHY
ncbi:ABC transporter permease [Candidatus Acetothermia bacterium]|nr:ABC transporter permease [Candidatus Acetothermia bacterium]